MRADDTVVEFHAETGGIDQVGTPGRFVTLIFEDLEIRQNRADLDRSGRCDGSVRVVRRYGKAVQFVRRRDPLCLSLPPLPVKCHQRTAECTPKLI